MYQSILQAVGLGFSPSVWQNDQAHYLKYVFMVASMY